MGSTWAGYSHTLPIRVCAAQRGRDFEAPDLERGIHDDDDDDELYSCVDVFS